MKIHDSELIDDILPHSQVVFDYERLMTTELATTILTDFQQERGDCKTLAVHCQAGHSRSPGVAIALAELFQLLSPAELQQLRERHRYHNAFVYETLRKAFAAIKLRDLLVAEEVRTASP